MLNVAFSITLVDIAKAESEHNRTRRLAISFVMGGIYAIFRGKKIKACKLGKFTGFLIPKSGSWFCYKPDSVLITWSHKSPR